MRAQSIPNSLSFNIVKSTSRANQIQDAEADFLASQPNVEELAAVLNKHLSKHRSIANNLITELLDQQNITLAKQLLLTRVKADDFVASPQQAMTNIMPLLTGMKDEQALSLIGDIYTDAVTKLVGSTPGENASHMKYLPNIKRLYNGKSFRVSEHKEQELQGIPELDLINGLQKDLTEVTQPKRSNFVVRGFHGTTGAVGSCLSAIAERSPNIKKPVYELLGDTRDGFSNFYERPTDTLHKWQHNAKTSLQDNYKHLGLYILTYMCASGVTCELLDSRHGIWIAAAIVGIEKLAINRYESHVDQLNELRDRTTDHQELTAY